MIYFAAIAIPVHFYAGPLYMTSVRLVLLVMIVPMIINLVRGKYGRILATDILFFLFIAWMGVALAKNNPSMVVSQMGSLGIEFLGGYLLGRAFIRNERQFAAMVSVLLFMVFLTFPFAIHEALTGRPIIIDAIRRLPGITSEPNVWIEPRMGLERVQLVFAHPIHYGLFASSAFSMVLVGFQDIYSLGRRLFSAVIVSVCVMVSLSSGALLATVLQFFLILWAWSFNKVNSRWLLLLGLLAVMYVTIDLLSNRTPIRVFMSYATFSPHNAYWRGLIFEWGIKNVWANPIYGLGFNDWIRPWYMYSGSMDNFWLVMAVRYGIPGFLLVATGYILALWKVGRRNLDKFPVLWRFRRAWMIMFIGLTFTLTTVHIWGTMYSFVFFLFGSGMWFITADLDEDAQQIDTGEDKNYQTSPYARKLDQEGKGMTQDNTTTLRQDTHAPRYSRFPPKRREGSKNLPE